MTDLWLSEPFATLWKDQDPFQAVRLLKGKVYRELEARKTIRFEINGHGYFAKLHQGVGWWEIARELLKLRIPVTGARTEFNALQKLAELGVDSMRPVAFGVRGLNPAHQESFLITEELSNTESLEDYFSRTIKQPLSQLPRLQLKRSIIERVADMVRRMHAGGLNHRDCYLVHFLLHLNPPPSPKALKVSLIDLHRTQIRSRVPIRWRNKDLAALAYSSHQAGLSRTDQCRFLKSYFQLPLRDIYAHESGLIQFLAYETKRLTDRWDQKFAPSALAAKGAWHIVPSAPAAAKAAWPTLSSVFETKGSVISQDAFTQVLKAHLDNKYYYIKTYSKNHNFWRRWLGKSQAQTEWEHLQRLERHGTPAAGIVGFGQERSWRGFGRGALITEDIPVTPALKNPTTRARSWINPKWLPSLAAEGISSENAFDYFWSLQLPQKDEVNTDRGGESAVFEDTQHGWFVKRQSGHQKRSLQAPWGEPTFAFEFRALQAAATSGVSVPDVVYFGTQRRSGQPDLAILVTESLTAHYTSFASILEGWPDLPSEQRLRVLTSIGTLFKKLHATGVIHNSLYPKHVFIARHLVEDSAKPHSSQNLVAPAKLIDFEKIRFALFPGATQNDLNRFYRHCPKQTSDHPGLSTDDWDILLSAYHERAT